MGFLEFLFHVLEVQVLKATQKILNAVLHRVPLIQIQKILTVAIKQRVLKELMELTVVRLLVLKVQVLKVTQKILIAVLHRVPL